MFLDNKYTNIYYNIINRRMMYPLDQSIYQESHHIIPVSLGGSDHPSNLVDLTAREHFICHLLLVRMVTGQLKYKMLEAISIFSNNRNRKIQFTSRQVAIIRESNSIAASNRNKGNQYWKLRSPDSPELRKLKSSNAKKSKWVNNGTVERFTQNYDYYISIGYSFGRLPFAREWIDKIKSNSPHKPHTPEAIEKIRNANKGKSKTIEHRKNLSIVALNRPKYTCEHCNKQVARVNYIRWHGDNCKLNPINAST